MWDVETGARQQFSEETPGRISALAFSPDGSLLASTSLLEHHVRLWDLKTRRVSRLLTGHARSVNSVAFSPDGSLLATAGNDGVLGLWKVETGRRRATLAGHALSLRTVAFSPDGRMLALTTWDDDDVRLWNVAELSAGYATGPGHIRAGSLLFAAAVVSWPRLAHPARRAKGTSPWRSSFNATAGNTSKLRDEDAGRRARCPSCQRELIVPQPKPLPDGDFAPLQELGPIRTSGKAIASFVLGLCVPISCALTSLPAILFGILGLIDVNNPKKRLKGQGFAITGIVLGGMSVLVIPVLLGLLLPAIQAARGRSTCSVHEQFETDFTGARQLRECQRQVPARGHLRRQRQAALELARLILPYIDSNGLYEQFHLDEPWDSPHNKPLSDQLPAVYECPSGMAPPGQTTYEVVVDPGSMFTGEPVGVDLKSVTDGTANTLMVVEATNPVPWTKPEDLSTAAGDSIPGIGSKHPGGFNAAMVDGSIRFVRSSPSSPLSPSSLKALVTRDGGELVSPP